MTPPNPCSSTSTTEGTAGFVRTCRRTFPPTVVANLFDGAKVFSATKAAERAQLGDRVTTWLDAHPEHEIVDAVVTQSSDWAFHCLAITVFWRSMRPPPTTATAPIG